MFKLDDTTLIYVILALVICVLSFTVLFILLLINNVRTVSNTCGMKNELSTYANNRYSVPDGPLKGKVAIVTGMSLSFSLRNIQ